jgi:hypothetical protein
VTDRLADLVHRADIDGLVRHVDATCTSRDWHHLVEVRDAARAAVSTGRQLWPIATLANHRLALLAPAAHAVRALEDGSRLFMPGPVSEILAVHHDWEELSPHLPPGHDRSLVAHERALRGDTIDPGEPDVLEIGWVRRAWEPEYSLADYGDDGVDAPAPPATAPVDAARAVPARALDDPETVNAFRRLVEPWTAQSNGTAEAALAEGGALEALGALGRTDVRLAAVGAAEAVSLLAWAAASGGAHGKRRGAATGRAEAWWLLAVFTGLDEDWPCDPEWFDETVESLEFHAWSHDGAPTTGWGLGLVVCDPTEGISLAMAASDHR